MLRDDGDDFWLFGSYGNVEYARVCIIATAAVQYASANNIPKMLRARVYYRTARQTQMAQAQNSFGIPIVCAIIIWNLIPT